VSSVEANQLPAGVKMKLSGRSRTEGRRTHGDKSPEVKKRRSCSPLRKRRRSQTPGGCGKEQNAHEVLKGILKNGYSKEQTDRGHCKISREEVKITRKTEAIPSSRRSPSPGRRWGHQSVRHSPRRGEVGGRSSRWRRSPSPCAGSRKGRIEKRSPQRRPRDLREDRASLRHQHKGKEEEEEVGKGDGRVQESLWNSSKERRVGEKSRRSSSREDFVSSSSRNDMLDIDCRKVYISWDRFVPKSFLHAHFSRFGEVEYIWMADRGSFFGFVCFVREEVGRSLLGACHSVEGVQIVIKRARPDWKLRDRDRRRNVPTCAFFKEGRCLRSGHCQFLHTVEPRTSRRSRERSGSMEKARRNEFSSDREGAMGVRRDVSSKLTEQKKEGRKSWDLLEEGPLERDGRLRPPPSVQEKEKDRKKLPPSTSATSAAVSKKEEISKEEKQEKMGDAKERPSKGARREVRGNDPKVKSSCDNMDPDAMRERIRQLEEALKEKEEAEDRKKRFLKAGKHDKSSRMKEEEAKSSDQSSKGSRKNCHLVKSLAKRFKRVENESTSSSSEDTDGYDSTSDSNTPSQSPSPPARKLKVVQSEGNHDQTGEEINVEGTAVKENRAKEILSKEAEESEGLSMSGKNSDCGKNNVVEKDLASNEEKLQVTNEEVEDQKKNEEDEEGVVDVNENMLGSEKEAVFGEDLASADFSKVRVASSCLINRLDNLESDFNALQEEGDVFLESLAAKKEKDEKIWKELERDRLSQEEKEKEARCDAL